MLSVNAKQQFFGNIGEVMKSMTQIPSDVAYLQMMYE